MKGNKPYVWIFFLVFTRLADLSGFSIPGISYDVRAICEDNNGMPVSDYREYYMQIIVHSISSSENLQVEYLSQQQFFDLTMADIPDTLSIGPFMNSGSGDHFEMIALTAVGASVTDTVYVGEALCGYLSHAGLNTAGYVCGVGNIGLVACASPHFGVTELKHRSINAYLLVDQSTDTIIALNTNGYFDGYSNFRAYDIYAFTFKFDDLAQFYVDFAIGDVVDVNGVDACYSFCGSHSIDSNCLQFDLALRMELFEKFVQWEDTLGFTITVYNQGNVAATNIQLTDYVPNGYRLGVASPLLGPKDKGQIQANHTSVMWNLNSNGYAVAIISDTIPPWDSLELQLNLVVNSGSQLMDLVNLVEISGAVDQFGITRDDEDSTPDNLRDNDNLFDNIINNLLNDEDDHDIAYPSVFDLALRKSVAAPSPVVSIGDTVLFLIEIFNQGSEIATNVEIGDFAFEGFIFGQNFNPDWKAISDHFELIQPINIDPEAIDSSYISFIVGPNAQTSNLINFAEIISVDDENGNNANAFDIDSEPDGIFDNDQGGLPGSGSDNEINDSSGKDEDDHDPAALVVCTPFLCKGDINLSLGDDCLLELSPEMFLTQITFASDDYEIIVTNAQGDTLKTQLGPEDIGKTYNVRIGIVGGHCPDNVCWMNMLIEDKISPSILCANDTLSCLDTLSISIDSLTTSCGNITVEVLQDEFTQLCDNDSIIGKRVRTIRLVDQSGNISQNCTADIYIKVPDIQDVTTMNDTILACDQAVFSNFGELVNDVGVPLLNGMPVFPNTFDNCNLTAQYIDQVITDTPCKKQILRMWTIYKWTCAGGDTQVSRPHLISIVDTVAPKIKLAIDTIRFQTMGLECTADFSLTNLMVTDSCNSPVTTKIFSDYGSIDHATGEKLMLPIGIHEIFIEAFDACHNVNRDTATVIVSDGGPPLVVCHVNTSVTLSDSASVEVTASKFIINWTDACSPVSLLVRKMIRSCGDTDTVFADRIQFCCADIGSEVMVVLRAVDTSGNYNDCMVMVNVLDGGGLCINPLTHQIKGKVQSIYGEEMVGVTVNLRLTEANSVSEMFTDNSGYYDFGQMPTETEYMVNPYKNDDWLNGVSTLDIISIQNHILSINPFEEATQFIAGDVNGDQSISAIDLVVLRKLILGLSSEIETNTSWRFAWDGQELTEMKTTKFVNPHEEYTISALQTDMSVNWTGVKVGDLSGNAKVGNVITTEPRSSQDIALTYTISKNEGLSYIHVYSPELYDFQGLQMNLKSNMDIDLVSLSGDQLTIGSQHVMISERSEISISYNMIEAMELNSDRPLFTLTVDNLSEEEFGSFFIDNRRIQAELYTKNAVYGLSLQSDYDANYTELEAFYNYPNPWKFETTVSYSIPEAGEVKWALYDSNLRLIQKGSETGMVGRNELILNANKILYSGAMVLELIYNNRVEQLKMIRIE